VKDLTGIAVSGSGSVRMSDLMTNSLTTKISGSGTITASGAVNDQAVDISGSGRYQAEQMTSKAVKARNVRANATASVALESGNQPVIAEGTARVIGRPYPPTVAAEFVRKFDWELDSEPEYDALIEVAPTRWLRW